MMGLNLKRLRSVFKGPGMGVFMDSDRLRAYYLRSDEMIEHQFDQVLHRDLDELKSRKGHDSEAWSWS